MFYKVLDKLFETLESMSPEKYMKIPFRFHTVKPYTERNKKPPGTYKIDNYACLMYMCCEYRQHPIFY